MRPRPTRPHGGFFVCGAGIWARAYFPSRRDASRRRFSAPRWLLFTSRMNRAAATTAAQTHPPMMMNPAIPCIASLRAPGAPSTARTHEDGSNLATQWLHEPKRRKADLRRSAYPFDFIGAGERNRTLDLRITSALLYQLSYTGRHGLRPLKPFGHLAAWTGA